MQLNQHDLEEARSRWPNLKLLVQWEGMSPSWSDLGCRGCWNIIQPNVPAVECGVGAFHQECFEQIVHEHDDTCPRTTLIQEGDRYYGPIGIYRHCDGRDYILTDHDTWQKA